MSMMEGPIVARSKPEPPSRLRNLAAHPLVWFVLGRLASLVFVLMAVTVAVFLMVQLVPGDPIVSSLGESIDPQTLQRLRHEFNFDRPAYIQLALYVDHVLHGNLGNSIATISEPVTQLIHQRIIPSAELAGAALLIVLVLGIALGMTAGALTREGRHRRFELGFTGVTSVLGSIPDYLTGTVLVFLFAVEFRFLPVAGIGGVTTLILPALAVSLAPTMILSRIVRVETLNVLAQDYIRTARSKRLPARLIYVRHALPNVMTAALTIGGLIFANIIGGTVIVENVFARPGLGTALVNAVVTKDYPVIQGITLVLATGVVLVNTTVDVLLALVDPRSLSKRR